MRLKQTVRPMWTVMSAMAIVLGIWEGCVRHLDDSIILDTLGNDALDRMNQADRNLGAVITRGDLSSMQNGTQTQGNRFNQLKLLWVSGGVAQRLSKCM